VTEDPDANSPPTEEQVRADQELAAQLLAASVLAPLNLLGPYGAAAATVATPIAMRIASYVVIKLAQRRVKHAAETVLDAAEAAELPLDDFIDRAVSDDRRHELLARTLTIAQDTALRERRRALGRALAAGVMGDDAKIDEELLFIEAVADLSEPHIRLLARMEHDAQPPGMSPIRASQEDSGLGDAIFALFGTLEAHGLIVRRMPGTRMSGPEQSYYYISALGREFLQRLARDASD
jgi:hypothetical protein